MSIPAMQAGRERATRDTACAGGSELYKRERHSKHAQPHNLCGIATAARNDFARAKSGCPSICDVRANAPQPSGHGTVVNKQWLSRCSIMSPLMNSAAQRGHGRRRRGQSSCTCCSTSRPCMTAPHCSGHGMGTAIIGRVERSSFSAQRHPDENSNCQIRWWPEQK